MHESFLKDIALVLGVAALTSSISYKLKLPSVLGYLIAGFIIGPYIPIPLFADLHRVESLSEFGVILVMFSIGMEFRLKKFFRVLPTSGITAFLEISALFLTGYLLGYFFGWSGSQSVFMGGALAISSTMIVSKIFEENPPSKRAREHVLGILVIQDVVAIILLTVLGAYGASAQLDLASLMPTVSKLIFILVLLTVVGLFVVPRFVKAVSNYNNSEVMIIVASGLCFVMALVVESLGYSVALGAFLAGILVAESGEGSRVEHLAKPLKDVFVAIFFVSVGMTVDPFVAIEVLPQSIIISIAVIFAQFFIVFIGSVLSGAGINRALLSALALGQIGEFSFIIAAIGLSAGVVTKEFQAIVVTVAIFTSLSSPILWKKSERIVGRISKLIPKQMRIAFGLYEAWFKSMQENRLVEGTLFKIPRKMIFGLLLDAVLLVSLPPLILKFIPPLLERLGVESGTLFEAALLVIILGLILIPIVFGFIKMASSLAINLSQSLFARKIQLKAEEAPAERLFKITVWSILCLLVSFPLLLSLSFFIESSVFIVIVVMTLAAIFYRLWKTAGEVALEYEPGGEKILSLIKKQTFEKKISAKKKTKSIVPGLDDLETVSVKNLELKGLSLFDLDIRNKTGATIVSILRGDHLIMFPNQSEMLDMDDQLQIWGDRESKKLCVDLLNSFQKRREFDA